MLATLSSFATQFDASLIEKGKALYENGKVTNLANNEVNWTADVEDTKKYKVTICEEDGDVTNIFCPCGPKLCPHVIGMMFILKEHLNIETEIFQEVLLAPPSYTLLGQRLNDIVYASRMPGSKDGELEELGESITHSEPDVAKFRAIIKKGLHYTHEKSKYPVLNGAKRLLGAAILKFEEADYEYVFAIARAVLTEICSEDMSGNSADECALAAVELLNTLCISPEVPADFRKEVFERVLFACSKELYRYYRDDLLTIVNHPLLDDDLKALATDEINHIALVGIKPSASLIYVQQRYIEQTGDESALQQFMQNNAYHYRNKLIEQAYEQKDYATIKKLAHEGININWQDAALWKKWLLTVAQAENDIPSIRSYHKEKYFKNNFPEDSYEICRATYTPDKWEIELQDWINRFEKEQYLSEDEIFSLAKIYIREGLTEKLLHHVQKYFSFSLGQLAEPILLPDYSEELMEAYRKWFIRQSGQSTQRDPIIKLRDMLKAVRSTTPGKKMVKELVPHILELHPTWKVLREELSVLL